MLTNLIEILVVFYVAFIAIGLVVKYPDYVKEKAQAKAGASVNHSEIVAEPKEEEKQIMHEITDAEIYEMFPSMARARAAEKRSPERTARLKAEIAEEQSKPLTMKELRALAKAEGVRGYSRMSRAEIERAIYEAGYNK